MKSICVFILVICTSLCIHAQYVQQEAPDKAPSIERNGTLGIGLGINNQAYGGIGLRYTQKIFPGLALTAAGGYNLVGIGFQAGVLKRFSVGKNFKITAHAMYGTNGAVRVTPNEYSRTFYGPTASFGFEFYTRKRNFFAPAMSYAFKSKEYYNFLDELFALPENEGGVAPFPLSMGFGYHF